MTKSLNANQKIGDTPRSVEDVIEQDAEAREPRLLARGGSLLSPTRTFLARLDGGISPKLSSWNSRSPLPMLNVDVRFAAQTCRRGRTSRSECRLCAAR
jgi:hypothetical protein